VLGVRNIFKLLGCHERDDTIQKSTGKSTFTFAEGCIQIVSTPSRKSTWVLPLMQCCPSPELARFWVYSLCEWLVLKGTSGGGFEDKEV
jgi:hypothetical protein